MNVRYILEFINSLDEQTLSREEALSDDYHQDIRIALCKNHTNMVVGCPNFDNTSGIVLHLVKESDSWKIANTLHPTSAGGRFGCSVDISADSKRIVVGSDNVSCGKHALVGMVHLFELMNNEFWVRIAQYHPQEDKPGFTVGALFGASVSLSDDGTKLVVGAPGSYNSNGTAYFYKLGTHLENVICEEIKKPQDNISGLRYGTSVSISGPGRLACISSVCEKPECGAVYCFTMLEDGFVHSQTLIDPSIPHFGKRIKMVNFQDDFKPMLKVFDANNHNVRFIRQSDLWVNEEQERDEVKVDRLLVQDAKITVKDQQYLNHLEEQEAKLLKQLEDIKTIRANILAKVS